MRRTVRLLHFGVNKGVTVLGDSVALRSKDQLESSIDNVAIDAVSVVTYQQSTICLKITRIVMLLLRMLSLLVVLMRLTTIKALLINHQEFT